MLASDAIGDTTRDYAAHAAAMHRKPALQGTASTATRGATPGPALAPVLALLLLQRLPAARPVFSGGKHEGDWELVQFRLGAAEKPEQAVFSQHKTRRARPGPTSARPANDAARLRRARLARQLLRPARTGPACGSTRPTARARRSRRPSRSSKTRPAWVLWPGFWGDTKPTSSPLDSSSPTSPGRARTGSIPPSSTARAEAGAAAARAAPDDGAAHHENVVLATRPRPRRRRWSSPCAARAPTSPRSPSLPARHDERRGRASRRRPRLRRLDERRRPDGAASEGVKPRERHREPVHLAPRRRRGRRDHRRDRHLQRARPRARDRRRARRGRRRPRRRPRRARLPRRLRRAPALRARDRLRDRGLGFALVLPTPARRAACSTLSGARPARWIHATEDDAIGAVLDVASRCCACPPRSR